LFCAVDIDWNFETYLVLKESWDETFKRFQQVFPNFKKKEAVFRQVCSMFAKISKRRTDVCQVCALYHRLLAKTQPLNKSEKADMEVCVSHRNIRDGQKRSCLEEKESLKDGECHWTIDYGQSKSIKMKPEEDSYDFFNKLGISVIASVCFLRLSGTTYKKVFCFYSMSITHTAQSSIDYFDRILDYSIFKSIIKIYLWSDNGGHFKNNDFIMHLKEKSQDRNIEIQYNQFCEYEGKDSCDQFFGSLSNGLENHTKLKPILDINDLIQFSYEYFKRNGTNEYVFEIYHPVTSARDVNDWAVDNLDDYLSFDFVNGTVTVAVLTAEPHTTARLKKKQKPKNKGALVYPPKTKEKEEETDKDKAKRRKKENFNKPLAVGELMRGQYNRRNKRLPGLKVSNNLYKILEDFKK
jgi:hypothetical protein